MPGSLLSPRHALLAAALLLAAGTAAARGFSGVVSHVTDGDTLWVQPDARDERPIKLRLRGIDAPEICQAWGRESREALASRVLHRRVHVQVRAHDSYERSLGNLWLHGEDISAWMVAQGHAWSYHHRRSGGPYAAQERVARAAQRGLFADVSAIEPRVFRQRHGSCRVDSPNAGKAF